MFIFYMHDTTNQADFILVLFLRFTVTFYLFGLLRFSIRILYIRRSGNVHTMTEA